MSENEVAEQVSVSDSDPGPATQSNGVTESNTDDDTHEDQVERDNLKGGGVLGDPEDGKSTEDTARDDMFVDCPDELITFDGKLKEEEAAGAEENADETSEENQVIHHQQQQSDFVELGNNGVVGDDYSTGQLEQLRLTLEKAVAEKESVVQEYQEERETITQGVFDLHRQLKALTCQQSLSPNEAEVGVREVTDVPLREKIKECLEFVKTASEERRNSVANLHELLYVKDREIEDLNAKVAQLTESNGSLQLSAEAQLAKDHSIDIAIDNTISSLATVVSQEPILDSSVSGKIVYIEEGARLLVEKYNQMLSEIYQLGESFSELGLDTREQEYGNILVGARGGLLELKRNEAELAENLSHLEEENRKLVEELDKERVMIGTLNAELGNMKTELEQEKVKCANTKEKLSMAVTKGKALVQQRDSLKMSLADKCSELDKCLIELEEKSVALAAAELAKEQLAQSENMVASLQSSLQQNSTIFEQVEEILSHAASDQPEIIDMLERLRWLVDDRNTLKGSFLELGRLKEVLSLVDLPESVSSSDLESQMNWVLDSFHKARDGMDILQEEISATKEASLNCIDRLSISLLLELQEKYYLESDLTDLRFNYEELVHKNHQISLEKDQIVKMLVDFSGLNLEDEGIDQFSSSNSMIIDLCFQIMKREHGQVSRASPVDAELFERIQSLLFVRDQGLMLCEDLLEEEMLIRSDVNKLSNDLKEASEEIIALKEERSSLLKDLQLSEDKTAMLRDKLSMAVKKGKGLVQDRDNLKGLLNEKNSEIEQLKVDLQKQESLVSEYRDEINRLSSDVDGIPKLEADLLEIKRERNQFEQFLMESNSMLQSVMECIDGIVLPVEPGFGEPTEKVKWLAGYVSECQDVKVHVEQELKLLKEDAIILEAKLAEAQATVNSLEQRLSSSEDSVTQLAGEKTELEQQKAKVEEQLWNVKENLAEVCSTSKSLEDALSQAEKDISVLSKEKEQAQVDRITAETELEKAKNEAARQTIELAEARRAIKDLEDELSQVESQVNLLTEKYDSDQVVKIDMENELKSLRDEAENNASKVVDASATVRSLEDALLKAQNDISALEDANKIAKQEISSLGSKLNTHMEALAGKNDSLEDISVLSKEKEQAQVDRIIAETELEKTKNEAARQTIELAEARKAIKDLEDELSQVESQVNLLTEKYDSDQVVKIDMENELKSLRDEAENNASKLVDASATVRSLEDALLKAQNDISALEDANKIAKQEISSLGSKLNTHMEALAGKNDSLENKSLELIGLLHDLQVLMSDNTLFPRIKQCFEKNCETLKNMGVILNKIRDNVAMTTKDSEGDLMTEEDPHVRNAFLDDLEKVEVELDERDINGTDIDTIISSFGKIVKGFQLRNKHIADKFDDLFDSIDEFISPLHEKLLETETNMMNIIEEMETMKEKANTMGKLKEEKENIIATLENDISVLVSACTHSANELQNEVDNSLGQLGSIPEVEKLNQEVNEQAEYHNNSKYVAASKELVKASKKVKTLIRQFEFKSDQVATEIADLQNKLNKTTVALESVTDERDINKNRVLQLESDIHLLQSTCSELKDKSEGYHSLDEKLKVKEEEISSMRSALFAKEEESSLLSASQARDLFDKIDRMKIPIVESEEDDMELHTSDPVKKLFYAVDSVTRLHHQINSLSQDKKEMQSIFEIRALEIKDLKEEVRQLNKNCEDSRMVKNELSDLTLVLEKIMDTLAAKNWVVDRKSKGVKELIPALEKHILAILSESENSRSKAQELGLKLVESQKFIDELTTKVKLLEDSLQDKISQPDVIQERSIFEAPSLPAGSEITEVEEGSLGKKAVAPVPLSAHVRNMRKGSTDHLALDISEESDQLINSADTDDDKGHAFKSLNTSGFVPKQGKVIADRIDGIWVSGSRVLMSRPRARLGIIGYLLIMHLWLLGAIL